MKNDVPYRDQDPEEYLADKRKRKISRFYRQLTSWAGTSVMLVAMNIFLVGHITWAKFAVFFWGIAIVSQVFEIIRLQKEQRDYESSKYKRPYIPDYRSMKDAPSGRAPEVDYSEDLLHKTPETQKEEDLTEYRKLPRTWREDDLV